MTDSFINLLCCPLCEGKLERFHTTKEDGDKIEWGTIICIDCNNKFPVAFGIPIMMPPYTRVDVNRSFHSNTNELGPIVSDLTRQIGLGEIEKVQKELLIFRRSRTSIKGFFKEKKSLKLENKLTRLLPNPLVKLIGKRTVYFMYYLLTKLTFQDARMRKKEDQTFEKLLTASSSMEFIDLYFGQMLQNNVYGEYYKYRFGQPRHLAALSLLTNIPEDANPVLDIACGIGHFMHYFTNRSKQQPVIGMDKNFGQLYLAKKFVSPEGNYFCADAGQPLPFKTNSFSGVFCSDAFMFFPYRQLSVREMKRLLNPNGVAVINRIYSYPIEGYEDHAITSAKKLKSYFSDIPNVVLSQNYLLDCYIQKEGPDLSVELELEELNKINWISIIASRQKNIFRNYGTFKEWPHEKGYLQLNPHYHEKGKDDSGNLILKFEFPSSWYEFENQSWMKYAPETVLLSPDTLNAISNSIKTPEVNELISKLVVIGMPELYQLNSKSAHN